MTAFQAQLRALLHDDDSTLRQTTAAVFTDEIFRPVEGLTHQGGCRLTYNRMRFVNEHVPPATTLLKDPRSLLVVLETAAVASPPVFLALTIHYCLSVNAIAEFGAGRDDLTPYQEDLDTMSSIGTLVVTELGHGNSHSAIRTEAHYQADTREFILHTPDPGAQKFMSNNGLSEIAKIGVVYARLLVGETDHGVFPFVVRLRDNTGPLPGVLVHALPETPVLPLDYAIIAFDHLRLPKHALLRDSATLDDDGTLRDPLGGPASRLQRSLTVRENAWTASAAALAAVSRAAITIALRHAYHRVSRARYSADRVVVGFRTQQRALFGALATTYATTCLVNRAKRAWIDAQTGAGPASPGPWSPGALGRTLGLAKATACQAAERVTRESGLRSGAHGMFSANRLIDYHGLAHALNPAAGDSHLILLEAGRALVSGEHYQPPESALPTRTSARVLGDRALWLELAETRERRLFEQLAGELTLARRRGQEPFETWNNRLPLALEFANAHSHRLILESFGEAVDTVTDRRARSGLEHLITLYAVEDLDDHLGWYLTERLVTEAHIIARDNLVNTVCERLLPDALDLVEAFDLPDDLLRAPINEPDYTRHYGGDHSTLHA
ncbi:acyl-CoA dehydrogenase [Amycolatopsis sp. H20-H5]|uniref:acyl-CoA dehydrogenase n=1 Tax=Amycolatopsis sp. H20-H5 TaxID=3046309 RepID=UPI002DBB0B60|nr:acyl-CoA dehydrogenase [Amycolatopsis sp. H20-H5]MEC3974512.1 acyl-CoA dehydrogenase [Amycolatopsis sp. H20-H5]